MQGQQIVSRVLLTVTSQSYEGIGAVGDTQRLPLDTALCNIQHCRPSPLGGIAQGLSAECARAARMEYERREGSFKVGLDNTSSWMSSS